MKKCAECKKRPTETEHPNCKYCTHCKEALRKRPKGKLTPSQERMVRKLAGKMFIKDLAKKVGTSDSNLDRWAYYNNVNINALRYPKTIVEQVCEYYAKHGKIKTQKKFPDIKVRSIVEKYAKGKSPRQRRWTDQQVIQLARMAGLVSMPAQARYFNRPYANAGSIKSAWVKKFKSGGGCINGISLHKARLFIKPSAPVVETGFWVTRDLNRKHNPEFCRKLILWVDAEKHLRPDCPHWFKDAAFALAKFQRWLHGLDNPRPKILKMIREIEGGKINQHTKDNQ